MEVHTPLTQKIHNIIGVTDRLIDLVTQELFIKILFIYLKFSIELINVVKRKEGETWKKVEKDK